MLIDEDITVDQHQGVVFKGCQIKIYVNEVTSMEYGKRVKQQILENQEKAEKCTKFQILNGELRGQTILQLEEIKQLKEELEGMTGSRDLAKAFLETEMKTKKFYRMKLEKIEELRKWIERDITASQINKDRIVERMATHYNKKLKKILEMDFTASAHFEKEKQCK